jgi:hypothetical protein
MASAHRNALQRFRIHKDLPNFFMHLTLSTLFDVSMNTTSYILKRFHCLLPHIAEVACAPSTPPFDRINHFLTLVSPKSTHSSLKLHINDYLSHSLYNKVFSNAPDHFHLLPSLYLLRHPTLSSDYVAATHTTASSTGNSTQASNVNYVSFYTRLSTNQFVHVAPWLIFLVTTSSNAHASAKLEFTIQFVMALHKLFPQFSLPLDMSPLTLQWTWNPSFTSHQTLTHVSSISPLAHIQTHHLSHPTAAPLLLLALISPSAPYLPSFPSFLVLLVFYKLLLPMPTHIYRNANAENLVVSTKPTRLILLLLGVTN